MKAMIWVMEDAPVYNTGRLAVLNALADRASDDGTAAWPSQEWIAYRARCSDRTVRRHLVDLEADGIIRRGDQNLVSHLRVDLRPVVWDLNMSLDRTSPIGRGDLPDGTNDRTECPGGQNDRADTTDRATGQNEPNDRTLVSDKPSLTIHEPSRGGTEVGNLTSASLKNSTPPPGSSQRWEPVPRPAAAGEIPPTWIADPRRARCRAHAGIESPPPCRACAAAREDAERARDARAVAARADADDRRAAIDACGLCDHNGLVAVDGAGRVGRCPHDPGELAAIQRRNTVEDADRATRQKTAAAHTAPARGRWRAESQARKRQRAAEAAAKAKADREAAEAAEREAAAAADAGAADTPDTETR